ncbi:hypothetical protein VNO78_20417 [Psophocarpus tetragonolobus]|uniref:Uncharacterized protein n=1 Tax=Psophocarpus tetragonolobus TaxID=3891 RepID=A0AAN9S9W9_PSOTE
MLALERQSFLKKAIPWYLNLRCKTSNGATNINSGRSEGPRRPPSRVHRYCYVRVLIFTPTQSNLTHCFHFGI